MKSLAQATQITLLKVVQLLLWIIGATIVFCLFFYPKIGLTIFWNILIPVAPFLLVIATGLWRNICPLATTNLLPRNFNFSKRKIMSPLLQSKLQLISVIALFSIVPFRHLLFNNNGMATGLLLIISAIIGFIMSMIYDWKSGWCASLCPIHPIEKLYGNNTLITLPNAHCVQCVNCSIPCPDATPNMHPAIAKKNIYQQLSAILLIGGLPGFIWGWFRVPDAPIIHPINIETVSNAFKLPLLGLAFTLLVYLTMKQLLKTINEKHIRNLFAATSVSCYYWYRIPDLLGFGAFPDNGRLVDLRQTIPAFSIQLITSTSTLFFFTWFLTRKENKKSWMIRPAYAKK